MKMKPYFLLANVISYLATRWFYKQTHLFSKKKKNNIHHTIWVTQAKCYKTGTESKRCIWISPSTVFAVNVRPPLSVIALVCPPTFCWVQGKKVWLLSQQKGVNTSGRAESNKYFHNLERKNKQWLWSFISCSQSDLFWIMKQGCQRLSF